MLSLQFRSACINAALRGDEINNDWSDSFNEPSKPMPLRGGGKKGEVSVKTKLHVMCLRYRKTHSQRSLELLDRNHRQLVRHMTLVCVTDVKLAFVLDGIGIAEIGAFVGDTGAFGKDRTADDEDFAEDGFIRLAHRDGQGRAPATGVRRGGADEVTLAGAQDARVRLTRRHRQVRG